MATLNDRLALAAREARRDVVLIRRLMVAQPDKAPLLARQMERKRSIIRWCDWRAHHDWQGVENDTP